MRIFLCIIIACAVGLSITTPVLALTVSPARVEITGDKGTALHGEIEVFNEQAGLRTFFTSFENFEPSGDSGAPRFIGAKDGLATWIHTENKISVSSGERLKVPFSIVIPKDATPGGYFAAIFFGSQAPGIQGGGEVSIGGKIGVLILLRVSGEVVEGGGLIEFFAPEKQRLFTSLPIAFEYRFSNSGGDRVVPQGEIKIKNTLQITSAKLLANENQGSVLPNSTRKFSTLWGSPQQQKDDAKATQESPGFFTAVGRQWQDFHFGWYAARLHLAWGASQQTAVKNYHFFIVPVQLLLVIIITLLVFGFAGRIAIKKYNRWVIAKATQPKK